MRGASLITCGDPLEGYVKEYMRLTVVASIFIFKKNDQASFGIFLKIKIPALRAFILMFGEVLSANKNLAQRKNYRLSA